MIKNLFPWIILPVIFWVFLGCDNSLDPIDEEKGAYSIYGYLNLYKDINYIRVKNLNITYLQDSTNIDAEVTLENIHSGATEILEDTIVVFDSLKTHNFRSTMDIQPHTEYRVSVERSDGKKTSATATTPHLAETSVAPARANCTTKVNIDFEPVSTQHAISLDVGFHYNSKEFWVRANEFLLGSDDKVTASFLPWDILDEAFGPGGSEDIIGEDELAVFCDDLDDEIFMVRYTHYGPDLYANTITDTLRIPGGAGRFGALYSDTFTFRIDTTSVCPPQPFEECVGLSDQKILNK